MTKAQIINLGGNLFVYSKRKTWLGAFVFGLGFFLVMQFFYNHTAMMNVLSITPLLTVICCFVYTLNKAGKKYWNDVKDKEQPIRIDGGNNGK
jgi:hypothetical protein